MTEGPHVHVPFSKITEHISFINAHRFNLEIYFSAHDLDSLDAASLSKIANNLEYGPAFTLHAPFMDLSPGAVDNKIREITVSRFDHVLQIANVLRSKCVVFHSGYEKWKYGLSIDLWLAKSLETWKPLNEQAKKTGVKIAIENIFEDEPANLKMLIEKMNSDNFGLCFDTGHWNLFSRVPLHAWLESLGAYIIELHLHDNDGSADQHLPIGDGTFDFKAFFGALRQTPLILTVEAHSPERVMKSLGRLEELKHGCIPKNSRREN
jgi:sugar phosphate isomerase/epimerase